MENQLQKTYTKFERLEKEILNDFARSDEESNKRIKRTLIKSLDKKITSLDKTNIHIINQGEFPLKNFIILGSCYLNLFFQKKL